LSILPTSTSFFSGFKIKPNNEYHCEKCEKEIMPYAEKTVEKLGIKVLALGSYLAKYLCKFL
jgi:hypothetical protein